MLFLFLGKELNGVSAIQLEDILYKVDETPILTGITGSFAEGAITTLVGPSGAGKTTLLKLCNGLLSPDEGRMTVLGKAIGDYEPTDLRRTVGMALQQAPMIPGTVYDNLNLPAVLKGETLREEEAGRLLQDVGLGPEYLKREADELSGGQQQKVSVARTLVNRPRILLLDEITSSLDRTSVKEVEELIQSINKKYKVTIIWITHNLEQAIGIGDSIWVMMDGELVDAGDRTILQSPRTERVRQFVEGERV